MQFYDSVYQSADCPPEWVIQDNEMLDKWWEAKVREIEEDRRGRRSGTTGRTALAHENVTLY